VRTNYSEDEEKPIMPLSRVGVVIAKPVFHVQDSGVIVGSPRLHPCSRACSPILGVNPIASLSLPGAQIIAGQVRPVDQKSPTD
jgi:hypothetical protein